jgi:hypothetical protein
MTAKFTSFDNNRQSHLPDARPLLGAAHGCNGSEDKER